MSPLVNYELLQLDVERCFLSTFHFPLSTLHSPIHSPSYQYQSIIFPPSTWSMLMHQPHSTNIQHYCICHVAIRSTWQVHNVSTRHVACQAREAIVCDASRFAFCDTGHRSSLPPFPSPGIIRYCSSPARHSPWQQTEINSCVIASASAREQSNTSKQPYQATEKCQQQNPHLEVAKK